MIGDIDAHLDLFKGDWIRDPEKLRGDLKAAKVQDHFTAELAAWCAEIHAHLQELEQDRDFDLMLMGGNGASLRLDAARQRGSRDNDYLTAASREQIEQLMEDLGKRFADLGDGLMQPWVYVPKGDVPELDMVAYVVEVPLRLTHQKGVSNGVKVEFHFEGGLPPGEMFEGVLGPAQPQMHARLPKRPYQIVLKLMTLAGGPVGIDESRRSAAVPRQIYDLDELLGGLTEDQWPALADYVVSRYAHECGVWKISVSADEPWAGLQARLTRWADCVDEESERWKSIRAMQQSQLRKGAQAQPSAWRARAQRLALAALALQKGDSAQGWALWQRANQIAGMVPDTKSRAFRGPLAALTGVAARDLPLQTRDYVWEALLPPADLTLIGRLDQVEHALSAVST